MKYEIKYEDKNLKRHTREYSGTYDGARKAACLLLMSKRARYTIYIHRPGYRWAIGEVWSNWNNSTFSYLSGRAGEGIIWKVNPRTGKLTSKLGYEE